jgi:hypothetical protein
MIYAVSFKHTIPDGAFSLDVTSRSNNWGKHLSPFNLGPVKLYDEYWSYNIENAFQYSKIYVEYQSTLTELPSEHYYEWAQKGWLNPRPIKYPCGVWSKHLYHWWDGKKLNNLEAQNEIFLPLYKATVLKTSAFQRLKEMYDTGQDIYLKDFESYLHRYLNLTWHDVINNPDRPVGQAFALAMILEGFL